MSRAQVLVYGATGYTGRLVCEALARRELAFAVAGRSKAKLEEVARDTGAVEVACVPPGDEAALDAAVRGRTIVCACAGPFVEVGEPVARACARLGVHYADTTGEQAFVRTLARSYDADAERSGACLAPAMAYEIAIADLACSIATERLGNPPDELDVAYMVRRFDATRGTKRSAVGVLGAADPMQWVDGALVLERPGARRRRFPTPEGSDAWAVSFPSPEAVLVPRHTGARTVRSWMAMSATSAWVAHRAGRLLRGATRGLRATLSRAIDRAPAGPTLEQRARAGFCIVAEARLGETTARAWVVGRDPYGVTAELQAFAAREALLDRVRATGVRAACEAFDRGALVDALAAIDVTVV